MLPLRDYQEKTILEYFNFLKENPYGRFLAVAPMGSGKSRMQLAIIAIIKKNFPGCNLHLITTRLQIIRGYLQEIGIEADSMTENAMRKEARRHGIFTYISYRNLLNKCKLRPPDVLIIDEAHNFIFGNIVTDQIFYFCPKTSVAGFTATPYLYNAQKTIDFKSQWDKIYTSLTLPDAISRGFFRMPSIEIVGLIDDDKVKISSNEFSVSSVEAVFNSAGESILAQISEIWKEAIRRTKSKSGIIIASSVAIAKAIFDFIGPENISIITHKTPFEDRQKAIRDLATGRRTMVSCNIVSEGFNLPALAWLIDAKPMLSVRQYVQMFGRIGRPYDIPEKVYYCINRNLERFSYVLAGGLPPEKLKEAQEAFDMPSSRLKHRVFGLEKFGRLKQLVFQTKEGIYGAFYLIGATDLETGLVSKVAAVMLPNSEKPIVAKCTSVKTDEFDEKGRRKWKNSKWQAVDLENYSFEGYQTDKKKYKMSPRQAKAWERGAGRLGLNPDRIPNAREFQIFFILSDLGIRL